MSADLQLYRTAILAKLDWPERNRKFQSDLAALHAHLKLPAEYCHELTGIGVGFTGEPSAIEKRITRHLWESREAEKETGVKLFDYKKGGGLKKKPTAWITNHLNTAANALAEAVTADTEPTHLQVKIDRHLPNALRLLPRTLLAKQAGPPPALRGFRTYRTPPAKDNGIGLSVFGIAAEAHAADGHRVVPLYSAPNGLCDCKQGPDCKRPGKHPRLIRYLQCASREIQQIRKWWRRWPTAGVGLLTGCQLQPRVYFVSIDIDRRHFGHGVWSEILRDLGIEEPRTRKVITADGWQLHLMIRADKAPASFAVKSAVDLKGANNQVVVPPTIRKAHSYVYEDDTPIAEATGALAEWIMSGGWKAREPIFFKRHDWLKGVARRLAGNGLITSEIFGTLVVRRETCCHPTGATGREITDDELQDLARWAYSTEQTQRANEARRKLERA